MNLDKAATRGIKLRGILRPMSRKGTKAKGELDGAEPIELPPLHKLTIGVVEPKEDASGLSKGVLLNRVLLGLGPIPAL